MGGGARGSSDGELIADKDNRFKFQEGKQGPLTLKSGESVKFRTTSVFGGEKAKDGAVHSFVVRKLRDHDPAWSVRLKKGSRNSRLLRRNRGLPHRMHSGMRARPRQH